MADGEAKAVPKSPKTAQSKSELWKTLELVDSKALDRWLASDVFLIAATEFLEDCWIPKQQLRKESGQKRAPPGPALGAVRNAIARGEAAGNRKYSRPTLDKTGWTDTDHYARCILQLMIENDVDQNGLFFESYLDEEVKYDRLWRALASYIDWQRKKVSVTSTPTSATKVRATSPPPSPITPTPIRRRRGKAGNATAIAEPLSPTIELMQSNSKFEEKESQQRVSKRRKKDFKSQEKIVDTDDSEPAQAISNPPPAAADNQEKESKSKVAKQDKRKQEDDAVPEVRKRKKHRQRDLSEQNSPGNAMTDDPNDQSQRPDKQANNMALPGETINSGVEAKEKVKDEVEEDVEEKMGEGVEEEDGQDEREADVEEPLSALDIMVLEAEAPTKVPLHRRLAKHELILKVLGPYKTPSNQVGEEDLALDEAQISHLNAENEAWKRTVDLISPDEQGKSKKATDPMVNIPIASEDDLKMYAEQEALFANPDLERDNYIESCKFLRIKNYDKPTLKGMLLNQSLQAWQVVAIKFIFDCIEEGLRGCVIADVVGTGKTWEVGGYLLAAHNKREKQIKKLKRNKEAYEHLRRPSLIICPPNLIAQWQEEISKLCGQTFKFINYYGDIRGSKDDDSKYQTKTIEKDDPLFDGSKSSGRTLVFTSYDTLRIRHGPEQVKAYRRSRGMSKQDCGALFDLVDPDWPGNLSNKFNTVVLDEAHKIKHEDTKTSTAVFWLKPRFYVMASATPCSNRGEDFSGFVKLLDPGRDKWDPMFGEDGYADINPFAEPKDADVEPDDSDSPTHTKTLELLVSHDKFVKHVKNKALDPKVRGKRLRKVWSKCLLRRTYGSVVHGKRIGDSLPQVNVSRVMPTFTSAEKKTYKKVAEPLLKNMMMRNKAGKLIYRRDKYRKLVLLSTWTGFGSKKLDKFIKTKTMSEWEKEGEKIIWLWYNKMHPDKPVKQDDVETLLGWVLTGSPKLRALLAVLDSTLIINQEKELLWTTFPAQQLLLFGTLKLLRIDARLFHSGLTLEQRKKTVRDFTTIKNSAMVLIGNFFLNCHGLNLHYLCHRTTLFDPAPSQPVRTQAIGRVRRFGRRRTVQVMDYCNPGSFDRYQSVNNATKAIPQLIAELNIFRDLNHPDGIDNEIDLGQFVKIDNKVMSTDQADADMLSYTEDEILTDDQLIEYLSEALIGSVLPVFDQSSLTNISDEENQDSDQDDSSNHDGANPDNGANPNDGSNPDDGSNTKLDSDRDGDSGQDSDSSHGDSDGPAAMGGKRKRQRSEDPKTIDDGSDKDAGPPEKPVPKKPKKSSEPKPESTMVTDSMTSPDHSNHTSDSEEDPQPMPIYLSTDFPSEVDRQDSDEEHSSSESSSASDMSNINKETHEDSSDSDNDKATNVSPALYDSSGAKPEEHQKSDNPSHSNSKESSSNLHEGPDACPEGKQEFESASSFNSKASTIALASATGPLRRASTGQYVELGALNRENRPSSLKELNILRTQMKASKRRSNTPQERSSKSQSDKPARDATIATFSNKKPDDSNPDLPSKKVFQSDTRWKNSYGDEVDYGDSSLEDTLSKTAAPGPRPIQEQSEVDSQDWTQVAKTTACEAGVFSDNPDNALEQAQSHTEDQDSALPTESPIIPPNQSKSTLSKSQRARQRRKRREHKFLAPSAKQP